MAATNDIKEFLTSRRARITPEQAGLPVYGSNRRVTGLRREEVAMLAGISAEYYVRLERGNVRGVSDDVLDGIARALQLDEAERGHLFDLVRAVNATASRRTTRKPAHERVRPGVERVLDSIIGAPALVINARGDILAANTLGRAFYADLFDDAERPVNVARYVFLNTRAADFFGDWNTIARDLIGALRAEAGRDPYDRRLSDLIGELSTRSEEFRVLWAAHDVKLHRSGTKAFHHAVVGDLALDYESFALPGEPGQSLVVYTAEPNSASRHALDLLASWTATLDNTADIPQAQ